MQTQHDPIENRSDITEQKHTHSLDSLCRHGPEIMRFLCVSAHPYRGRKTNFEIKKIARKQAERL